MDTKHRETFRHCAANEDGSIIIIVLLIMAVMTVVGIMSADTTITENYIIRNAGIYHQNVNLVESAAMEGLQELIEIPAGNPANLDPDADANDWIVDKDEAWTTGNWYSETFSGRLLTPGNSDIPEMIQSDAGNAASILETRGEDNFGNLRMAVVGWDPVGTASMKATKPIRRRGRILAEYVSLDSDGDPNGFGILRFEIGVERVF